MARSIKQSDHVSTQRLGKNPLKTGTVTLTPRPASRPGHCVSGAKSITISHNPRSVQKYEYREGKISNLEIRVRQHPPAWLEQQRVDTLNAVRTS